MATTLKYSWFFYSEAGSGLPAVGGGRAGGPAVPPAPGTPSSSTTGVPSAPPGGRPAPAPRVTVNNGTTAVATVVPNTAGVAHVILAVTDNGTPSLTNPIAGPFSRNPGAGTVSATDFARHFEVSAFLRPR